MLHSRIFFNSLNKYFHEMPHATRVDQGGIETDGIGDEMNAFRELKYLNVFLGLPDIGFHPAFESAILSSHVGRWFTISILC
jgi:hypothetical protein